MPSFMFLKLMICVDLHEYDSGPFKQKGSVFHYVYFLSVAFLLPGNMIFHWERASTQSNLRIFFPMASLPSSPFSIDPLDSVVEEDVAVLRDGLGLAPLLLLLVVGRGDLAVVVEVRHVAALEEEGVGHAHLLAGRRQPGALVHGVVAVVLLLRGLVLCVVILGAHQVVGHLLGGTGHEGGGVRREQRGGHRVGGGRRSPGRS